MKRTYAAAFVAGLTFALGLGISGMTQPAKIIAFLDVTGSWDPSLAFVMIGAVGVHLPFASRVFPRPLSLATGVDRRLLPGAALFGIGWGIAGFCPGPAVVSVVTLTPAALAFVAAMLAGMGAFEAIFERRKRRAAPAAA